MRRKIVAGNWKMNLNIMEGAELISAVLNGLPAGGSRCDVVFAPPYLHLTQTVSGIQGTEGVFVAAQNCHHEDNGAFTGEVGAPMLKNAGITHVIIGHSERREYNGETDEVIAKKVSAALGAGLKVIFCCGEPLHVRDANDHSEHVGEQIRTGLFHLSAEKMAEIAIAYEPIWAIGTGRTASTEQAQEMHAHVRGILAGQHGQAVADATPILYGGSCKPSNAAELFACPDVDGGLIGGASLKADDFLSIIRAMNAAG